MIRVLHLMDQAADEQARTLSSLLARQAGNDIEIDVRTIGRGGTYRSLVHALLGLRRILWAYDLVHAWDETGLAAARWAGAANVLVSFSAGVPQPCGCPPWLRAERVECVCSTSAQLAVARARLGESRCHLIAPAVEPAAPPRSRDELRARLGLGADDQILLAPGESTRNAGHETAAWLMSMLNIIDPRIRLLIAGRGPRASHTRRLAMALRRPELLCVATDAPGAWTSDDLLAVADMALFIPAGQVAPLPLIDCMAAGLPVVTNGHPALRGLLQEGQSALISSDPTPPAVARRVLELVDQPELRQRLSANARDAAAVRFRPADFVASYVSIYRNLADRAPLVKPPIHRTATPACPTV